MAAIHQEEFVAAPGVTKSPNGRRPERERKRQSDQSGVIDRFSYLWLVLAMGVFPFAMTRWTIVAAAWLYPVVLLRLVRTQPLWRGMLLTFAGSVLVLDLVVQGVFPIPGLFYHLAVSTIGLVVAIPYLVDRIVTGRVRGFVGTLAFPCAVTAAWYLWALVSPAGTWLNPAYSQYGNLPLVQLASVTGLWGIDFLVAWCASVVNWAWERGFAWPGVRGGVLLYATVLAMVLLFGGGRLTLFPPKTETVRAAGVSPSQSALAALDRRLLRTPEQSRRGMFWKRTCRDSCHVRVILLAQVACTWT